MPIASPAVFAQRLRRLSWREVFERAWIALLCVVLLKLVMPAAVKELLRPLVLAVPLSLIAAKDLSHLPDALARTRAALALPGWRATPPAVLLAWLPPELVGLLRLGGAQRRGFFDWLGCRPQPALPEGQALTYLEQGAYRSAFAIVLLATFVELPIDALVLPLFIHDAHEFMLIHALMLAGAISTLAWVLGDRWHVAHGCHVLTSDSLELRIGARTHGSIPLRRIQACGTIAGPVAAWRRQHGIERRHVLLASPLDKPNTVLILDEDSPVRPTHLGRERTGVRAIFLYLDRPHALIDALGKVDPVRPA
ncbi:hypothetical protein [Massilia sp. 9096]|uniref:hypothetical protein n=1 Tax=Massilia sp. 9096 TaxID=1500894 RepID=UPI00068987BD|nr:hypothetical protein [Massilia sp. 9096]